MRSYFTPPSRNGVFPAFSGPENREFQLSSILSLLKAALPDIPDPIFGQRFGLTFEQIIHSLADREKLREIVFRDLEKKKKLESFQHPRIGEEFVKLVEQYAGEEPGAIIQAVVPLLVEGNMQPIFHHVLMVYATPEEQRRRLIERDGLTEEMAMNMINSQISVEEKKGYCDLVVDNSGSLDETRKQVEAIWKKLKKNQKNQKA